MVWLNEVVKYADKCGVQLRFILREQMRGTFIDITASAKGITKNCSVPSDNPNSANVVRNLIDKVRSELIVSGKGI